MTSSNHHRPPWSWGGAMRTSLLALAPSALMSPAVTAQTTDHHAIRDLLRAPAPAALSARRRAPPADRRAGAGRASRPAGDRLPVGGRAPFAVVEVPSHSSQGRLWLVAFIGALVSQLAGACGIRGGSHWPRCGCSTVDACPAHTGGGETGEPCGRRQRAYAVSCPRPRGSAGRRVVVRRLRTASPHRSGGD